MADARSGLDFQDELSAATYQGDHEKMKQAAIMSSLADDHGEFNNIQNNLNRGSSLWKTLRTPPKRSPKAT